MTQTEKLQKVIERADLFEINPELLKIIDQMEIDKLNRRRAKYGLPPHHQNG